MHSLSKKCSICGKYIYSDDNVEERVFDKRKPKETSIMHKKCIRIAR